MAFVGHLAEKDVAFQLHMFSKNLDPDEAFENIRKCNMILMTETLNRDFECLMKMLGMDLPLHHAKKSSIKVELSEKDLSALRELLEPEYRLMDKVKRYLAG